MGRAGLFPSGKLSGACLAQGRRQSPDNAKAAPVPRFRRLLPDQQHDNRGPALRRMHRWRYRRLQGLGRRRDGEEQETGEEELHGLMICYYLQRR